MFGLSLGGGQTEIIMLISSARLGLELSLARSSRHFLSQTLPLLWFIYEISFDVLWKPQAGGPLHVRVHQHLNQG